MKPFLIRLLRLSVLVIVVPVSCMGWMAAIVLFPLFGLIDLVWHGITYLIYGKSSNAVMDWYEDVTDNGADWSTEELPRKILGIKKDV